jgi:hypothetical protein
MEAMSGPFRGLSMEFSDAEVAPLRFGDQTLRIFRQQEMLAHERRAAASPFAT